MDSSFKTRLCRNTIPGRIFFGTSFVLAALMGWQAVLANSEVRFVKTIDDGGKARLFREIDGLYLGAKENLYLVDSSTGSLIRFGDSGPVSQLLAGKGKAFRSKRLRSIAPVDGFQFVIAGDGVAVVDRTGRRKFVVGGASGAGKVSNPAGAVYSNNERFYVADRGKERIAVFGRDGVFLYDFGYQGKEKEKLSRPTHVGVDANERVYVLESRESGRISVFTHGGKLLARITANEFARFSERPPVLTALAVDRFGRLFVADKNNGKIMQLDWQAGKPVMSFGSRGKGRGQFRKVTVLAIAADGRLVIGDNGNRRIEIYQLPPSGVKPAEKERLPNITRGGFQKASCTTAYSLPGGEILCLDQARKRVVRLSAQGKPGANFAGPFKKPVAAAFDQKNIAVLDGRQLKLFSHQGKLRFTVGGSGSQDGQFRNPNGIALGSDRIYVADTGNKRVQIFSRDGVFLSKIANTKGAQPLVKRPLALALDSKQNLYVADDELKKVRIFSSKNALLYELGGDEKSLDRFNAIRDIAIDQDDNLYVLGSVPGNKSTVRIYSGPKLIFSFGSRAARGAGLADPGNISVVSTKKTTVSVFDRKRKGMANFRFLQVPGQVGGLVIEGGVKQTVVRWQKIPGSYVARYRVYGAMDKSGPYERIMESAQNKSIVSQDSKRRYTYFRVSALSGFDIEGLASQPREDVFQVGYKLYAAKKYAEATGVFSAAYRDNSEHSEVLEYLGRSLAEQGEYEVADRHFQDLANHQGFELVAIGLRAQTLFRAKEYIAARAVLDKAFAKKQISTEAYLLCGQLSLKLGDAIGAVTCLEKALSRDNKNVAAHFLLGQAYVKVGVVKKGLAEFDKAVQLDPDNATVLAQSGLALQSLKRHKQALTQFDKALQVDSLNAAARLGAAQSHLALKNHNKARSIALSMAGSLEQEAAGHYLLGIIALAADRKQEALLSLAKAGRAEPDNAKVWLALADVYKKLNNTAKTLESLSKAAKADPGSFAIFYDMGMLQRKQQDYAAASKSLVRAVSLEPGHFDARYALASVYFEQERYQEAGKHAKEAARLRPKNIAPYVMLADITNRQGKNGEAIGYLKKAIALKKTSAKLRTMLGRIYFENNIYDRAQKQLGRAVLLAPKQAGPRVLLGQLYMERREFNAAIKALNKAVRLDPSPDNKLLLNAAYAEKKKSLEFKLNTPRIVLEKLKLKQVFSAAYKQYANSPVGSVRVRNISGTDYQNLKLSFHIKDYMDFPVTKEIPLLGANSFQEVPLLASFNNKVLNIDEDTGVQVQLILSFFRNGKRDSIELTQPMTIYGKNAILWGRPNMVGSFVTPKDSTLVDFVRQGINQSRPDRGPLNQHMVSAMTLFNLLSAHGIKYVVDPNSPYSKVKVDQVDYVQFPRETLKLKSGDCDDLSVLISAGLENLGIETAFVDVPGHLLMMFNTGLAPNDRGLVSLQDDLLVIRDDRVWIPVEATMIATSFSEAWAEGARKYKKYEAEQKLKVISLKQAWEKYQPVTLAPASYGISVPAKDRVDVIVDREQKLLITKSLDRLVKPYRAMVANRPDDTVARMQVAIVYAKFGLHDKAFKELDQLLQQDPKNSAAHNNRGNIYLAREDFGRALEAYRYAEKLDTTDGGVKLNMALVYYKLGKIRQAGEKFSEATTLNKAIAEKYQAFGKLLVN